MEDVLEIACQFFRLNVEGAETLYSRRVYNPSSLRKLKHFGECCGVHACVVRIADFRCAQIGAGQDIIDECGLAHAAVAAEKRNLVLQQRLDGVHAHTRGGRHCHTLVADGLIELHHHLLIMALLVGKDVRLVEDEHHWHAVSLSRGEEAVDEDGAGLRIVDGDDKERLVHVGCDDMALLAEILRLAYDVVAAVTDGRDKRRALLIEDYLHTVAHSHRIGAAYALEAEVALYLTVHVLALVGADRIPTAGVLYYYSLHLLKVKKSKKVKEYKEAACFTLLPFLIIQS